MPVGVAAVILLDGPGMTSILAITTFAAGDKNDVTKKESHAHGPFAVEIGSETSHELLTHDRHTTVCRFQSGMSWYRFIVCHRDAPFL